MASVPPQETTVFKKEFTLQEPIPEPAITRVMELPQSGRLHRYNSAPGELSDVSQLEQEFASYIGADYCAALSSCGSAIYAALTALGAGPDSTVLCNALTLAPVPGAIENTGAR